MPDPTPTPDDLPPDLAETAEWLRRYGRSLPAVGSFEVLGKLGDGGSADVYRAYDPDTRQPVALKVFRRPAEPDSAAAARFRREADLLARLDHPHVVRHLGHGEADGRPYLVLQLVEGRSLDRRLREGGRPAPAVAAALVAKVADALDYAHRHGVVHRDVKPGNILIDEAGEPRLTDFGSARAEDDATLTAAGDPIGTPNYMSPEQAAGRAVDGRSDVFALGVVLYRLLTHRLPFGGYGHQDVLRQVQESTPPAPRSVDPAVPPGLEAVCLKALQKHPADRFPTAGAMAAALRGWLAGDGGDVRLPSWLWRVWRWWGRQPRLARWAAGTAAAFLILSGTLGLFLWNVAAREAIVRERAAAEAELRAKTEAWGLLDTVWIKLQGRGPGRRSETRAVLTERLLPLLAQVPPGPDRERMELEARSLLAASLGAFDVRADPDRLDLPDSPFSLWSAAIHPDGDRMAVGLPDGPARWDRGGPKPAAPAEFSPLIPRPMVAYSPDGNYLAFYAADGRLSVWDGEVSRPLADLRRAGDAKTLAVVFAPGVVRACDAAGAVRSWSLPDLRLLDERRLAAPLRGDDWRGLLIFLPSPKRGGEQSRPWPVDGGPVPPVRGSAGRRRRGRPGPPARRLRQAADEPDPRGRPDAGDGAGVVAGRGRTDGRRRVAWRRRLAVGRRGEDTPTDPTHLPECDLPGVRP